MPKSSLRKRPCSICRKWFLPDVRQIGRQVTCSTECSNERHRRKCAQWNRKNRVDNKSNYLSNKLQEIPEQPSTDSRCETNTASSMPGSRINLYLPYDILRTEFGDKNMVIVDYLIEQVLARVRIDSMVNPVKIRAADP